MAQAFDTDTFILEIQSRKAIYNLLSQEYSNRDLKKKQEEEIVELFGRVKYFKQSFWSPFLSQRMNPTLFFEVVLFSGNKIICFSDDPTRDRPTYCF